MERLETEAQINEQVLAQTHYAQTVCVPAHLFELQFSLSHNQYDVFFAYFSFKNCACSDIAFDDDERRKEAT
jgi:hypothetical protein